MKRQPLTNTKPLGRILAARRRALKLSQDVLARKLGLSQNRLSEIETDASAISIQRLLEILSVLGLELAIQERSAEDAKRGEW